MIRQKKFIVQKTWSLQFVNVYFRIYKLAIIEKTNGGLFNWIKVENSLNDDNKIQWNLSIDVHLIGCGQRVIEKRNYVKKSNDFVFKTEVWGSEEVCQSHWYIQLNKMISVRKDNRRIHYLCFFLYVFLQSYLKSIVN